MAGKGAGTAGEPGKGKPLRARPGLGGLTLSEGIRVAVITSNRMSKSQHLPYQVSGGHISLGIFILK